MPQTSPVSGSEKKDIGRALTYEERQAEKAKQPTAELSQPLTTQRELEIATFNKQLPSIDFHGLTREDVKFEVDRFLEDNPDSIVRIIYGRGKGVMENAVIQYLEQLQKKKNSPILGFRTEMRASVVVRVK